MLSKWTPLTDFSRSALAKALEWTWLFLYMYTRAYNYRIHCMKRGYNSFKIISEHVVLCVTCVWSQHEPDDTCVSFMLSTAVRWQRKGNAWQRDWTSFSRNKGPLLQGREVLVLVAKATSKSDQGSLAKYFCTAYMYLCLACHTDGVGMESVGDSGGDNISNKCTDDRTDVLRYRYDSNIPDAIPQVMG